VICNAVDDTVPPPPIQTTDRNALVTHLKSILRPNNHVFFWVKINDDVYFIEKYKSRYATDNGYAPITMTCFSNEENFYFNADNFVEFKQNFKQLIRYVRGYVIVQTGINEYDHPSYDEILQIGNKFSLTEGISDAKVFKI
tara:strand:- start:3483 stop:3905 length:423 start_codon:yes stop_codon:yes gene_type:complete